jgi:alpha-tubulin suppressor-like RCC1 family protein
MSSRKYILLSSTTPSSIWTVPGDFNRYNNIVHMIGAGAQSSFQSPPVNTSTSGGGGGYNRITNYTPSSSSIVYDVAATSATNTFFDGSLFVAFSGSGTTGGAGPTERGGSGLQFSGSTGGGGAGGPFGRGVNGSNSAGGAGGGGYGGLSNQPGLEIWPGIAGSGGGGYANQGQLYGGGAGGSVGVNRPGAQGVIIIEYTPANFLTSTGEELEDLYVKDYEVIDEFARTGSLWSWGNNANGQLGNNVSVDRSSPVQTVSVGTNWKQVTRGIFHAAAIKTDGTLWSWGQGTSGELGNNAITNRSSPVQTVSVGTNWQQVACGGSFTASIKTDGTLWLWGFNSVGELSITAPAARSSPIQVITGGTNWKQVSTGINHCGAIKTDGTLWLWGGNSPNGQLGDNTVIAKSSPVQTISYGANWKQVGCGNQFTAAVKTDGTLWLWGFNSSGGLGDNTQVRKSSPVQTIAGGTNWKQVSCGNGHTACIKTDGTLWLWGNNDNGNLGDNTAINKSSPVQTVSGGTNWKQVAAGINYTAAIKTDGTLWTWGGNNSGMLGDNTTVRKSSPVQTVSGGTNWKQVAVGGLNTGSGGSTSAIYFYDAGNLYPNL